MMTIKLIGLRTPAGQGFNNDTLIEFKDAQRCLCLNLRKFDFTGAQLLTAIIDARSTANAYSITELRMRDRVLHNTKLLQVAYPPMSGVRNDNIHHLQPLTSD